MTPIGIGRTLQDLEEAARRLGHSVWTLRRWAYTGKIASHKPGAKLMISDAEVECIIAGSERSRVVNL